MKNITTFLSKKTNWYAAFSLAFAGFSVAIPATSYATTPQLYIKTSTQTTTTGSTITAAIRINIGNVDGVDASLAFNPNYLQYVSTDATSSAFPIELASTASGSNVHIVRGLFSPYSVNSDALVATITFKAIAKTTSTSLDLTGNATYQGSYTNPTTANTAIAINDPAGPTADKTAPVVSIKNPLGGTKSSTSFDVVASATDNVKVTRMEVYIDNKLTYKAWTSSINPYTWNVQSSTISTGKHTITVKAYDAANNLGISYVTVSKI